MDVILRQARAEELEKCYGFIEEARGYHKKLGFEQWAPGYPTPEILLGDVNTGNGYVFADEDGPFGYACIMFGDDPYYERIEGAWKTDRPYAVVHRLAFCDRCRGRGLSKKAFSLIRELCEKRGVGAIRIDTYEKNTVMRRIIEREGFCFCGIIYFDGDPRLAFEWDR